MPKTIDDDDLVWKYVQPGRGYSDAELGDHFGVGRDAIFKRRRKLAEEKGIDFIETEPGRYRIDSRTFISNIKISTPEAMVLYVATRRLSRNTRLPQKYVRNALAKLAPALHQPMTEKLIKAAANVPEHPDEARREQILDDLMQAWSEKRVIRLKYRSLKSKEAINHDVSLYLIEPSPWSDSVYAVGYSAAAEAIIPFSLERIEKASLATSAAQFKEIDPETEAKLLQYAWGIWFSPDAPERVRLRFSGPTAARRLQETIWHPNEKVTVAEDGRQAIWQAPIAEWREMLPWIRGWGADCEVLEPEALREEIKQTAVALGKVYQTMTTTSKLPHHLPYAKTNPDNPAQIHLLLYHLIDVGQVARLMWREVLTGSIRQRLAEMLNLSENEAGRFIAFLAALHDIGKAFPGYQKKYAPDWLLKELQQAGLQLKGNGKAYEEKFPHGTVSTWVLKEFLPQTINLDDRFAYQIGVAIGGHHGSWPPPTATDRLELESAAWDTLRRDLFWEVQAVFRPPTAVTPPQNKTALNIFLTILSGLVSVADWVGSRNKECFGFVEQAIPTRQYALRSEEKARASLVDLGWFGWTPTGQVQSFGDIFAYLDFDAPRGLQVEVIKAAQHLSGPSLLILEAPTGIGKTETALYLADSWLQQQARRGLYVAMPTQATSNQMYRRVGQFLNHRYPDTKINYHLVHGQAAWQDTFEKQIDLQTVGDDERAAVQAESWFTPRKRTLLAPFGVGTVDQTFLSILQTRHFFVRLFGLSHKVIIFDEVHAYDTFMSTLFERLLTWLNAIGTSVIILSATLPAETRRKLVEAYTNDQTLLQTGAYPCLTIAAPNSDPTLIELTKPADVTVQLAWNAGREPKNILDYLQRTLTNGGCAAVICNTVRRAQEIYRELDAARQAGALDIPEDDLILFHARFPPVWRQEIEDRVLGKFGKPANGKARPFKAIVVATQVIEQSLDLDFDLMLTDLAPIDLIIQRAGRLHRHNRSEGERRGLPRRLVIIPPEMGKDGLPRFKRNRDVYEPYVLLRSYYALKAQGATAAFPADTTHLIEQVYGDIVLRATLNEPEMAGINGTGGPKKEARAGLIG